MDMVSITLLVVIKCACLSLGGMEVVDNAHVSDAPCSLMLE